jgi:hypothetical protein
MGSRRSAFSTRFTVIAAAVGVTAALASGLTGVLVAGPAAAAPTGGTSCRAVSLDFSFSGGGPLAHCSDHKDTGGGGTVAINGAGDVWTITWNNGQTTTLVNISHTPVSSSVCPTGQTEEHDSGTVNGTSTTSITDGMTLNANLCVTTSALAALPGKQVLTIS